MQDQVITESSRTLRDLTGDSFGKLTVLRRSDVNSASRNARWDCKCVCGQSVTATGTSLRNGRANRCRRCASGILIGQKFGQLTVAALAHHSKSGRYVECICSCGEKSIARLQHLRDGKISSCKYCGKVADLRGQRFGRLTAIELATPKDGKIHTAAYWKCVCDCGGTKITRTDYLRSGRCSSCGCAKLGRKTLTDYSVAWNQIVGKVKWQAEVRGLICSLSDHRIIDLARANCHYCGSSPAQLKKTRLESVLFNGIDRIDSAIGYVDGNVVPCCKYCNFAKNTMPYQEFRNWVARVYNHMFKAERRAKVATEQLSLTSYLQ